MGVLVMAVELCSEVAVDIGICLGLENIEVSKDLILSGFMAGNGVVLLSSAACEGDIATIQLIVSARRQARMTGKTLRLAEAFGAHLANTLRRGGVLQNASSEDLSFWRGEAAVR
jgi:hypothetical protein